MGEPVDDPLDGADEEDRRRHLAALLRRIWRAEGVHAENLAQLERLTGLKIRVASRTPSGVSLHVELPTEPR